MRTRTFPTLPFTSRSAWSLMTKKILAGVVLCGFLVSSWSCAVYAWKQKPFDSVKPEKREGLKIRAIQKKTGETIEFSKEAPATIKGDTVYEEKLIQLPVEKSNIDYPKYLNPPPPPPFNLKTKDGRRYRVDQWRELGHKIVFSAYASFPLMPLSDIDLVTIEVTDPASTLLLGFGIPIMAVLAIMGISMDWSH